MQIHKTKPKNDEEIKSCLKWLPTNYVEEALRKLDLEDNDVNRRDIRNVRYMRHSNSKILLALIEIADEYKKYDEKINQIVNQNLSL